MDGWVGRVKFRLILRCNQHFSINVDFDLLVDGLGDGVALLLGALLALGLVLRAAHPVLHGLALLPVNEMVTIILF